jgi:phospholipid/cholesterol/gamma-HCH transport system substrate-binding protein
MNSRTVEIWVGVFITAGFAALFMLAMKVSNLSAYTDDNGYEIKASFEDASGLKVRSPVTMAGVTLGRVTEIKFDNDSFKAIVKMQIDSHFDKLPAGTSANIYTAGLLGEKYIGLLPGSAANPCEEEKLRAELEAREPNLKGLDCAKQYLKQGSTIELTQGSLVLEKLIAQFVSKFMEGDGKKSEQDKTTQ